MIELISVCKSYRLSSGYKRVLDGVNLKIKQGDKLAIVGGNGSGKSTLSRIIAGAEMPTSGRIQRDMSVSWPLAFSGAFQGGLTGIDNIKFICRLYNTNYQQSLSFIREFSELGSDLNEPVKFYSSGMRARLAFALSMAVDFDCYVIDEVVAVGDDSFHKKCHEQLFQIRRNKSMVIISHDRKYLLDHCEMAVLVSDGKVVSYSSVEDCLSEYDASK